MGEVASTWKKGVGVVGVFLNYLLAPVFPKSSIPRLVRALDSPDEETSMAAYMALSKVGPKALDEVLRAVKEAGATAGRMQLLGDLGDPGVIPILQENADSPDEAVALAAREALALLKDTDSEGD